MITTLDERALRTLHLALEEDFAEVVVLYLDKASILLDEIRAAVLRGDYLAAANAAHTLKGSSSNLGLLCLVDLCLQLDDMLRHGDAVSPQQVDALYAETVNEYARARDLLAAYCQREAVNLA